MFIHFNDKIFLLIELLFDHQAKIIRKICSLLERRKKTRRIFGTLLMLKPNAIYCLSCLFLYSFVCLWISCYLVAVYILPFNDDTKNDIHDASKSGKKTPPTTTKSRKNTENLWNLRKSLSKIRNRSSWVK